MATSIQSAYLEEERLRRRQLGAFYTPASLAEILVRWTLSGKPKRLLDPSFGGCVFLDSAARQMKMLGVRRPGRFLCGVDIDPSCARHVEENLLLRGAKAIERDFLAINPGNEEVGFFEAVAGNPPYVRHHFLAPKQRLSAQKAAAAAGVQLSSMSSLWAYFVIHSVRFLKANGRMAFVLPEAALQAHYAIPVRKFLMQRFGHVCWVRLKERVFERTDEVVVILFAWGQGPGDEVTYQVSGVAELASLVDRLGCSSSQSSEAEEVLAHIVKVACIPTLGEVSDFKIGIVTGANQFFVLSDEKARELEVPLQDRVSVVAATRHLRGLTFSETDGKALVAKQVPCQLLTLRKGYKSISSPLRQWLKNGEQIGIHERHHCNIRREAWYQITTPMPPDAFATCCRSGSPLLMLNRARWHATNTLHTVYFKGPVESRAVAMGVLTTVAALAAEIRGRRYGGGVLKMEPNSWKALPVPLLRRSSTVFNMADRLLRHGREEEARRLADRVILVDGLGLSPSTVEDLRRQVSSLATWRRPYRVNK